MLQIGILTHLRWHVILMRKGIYPVHAGSIGCIMLAVWPYKYKLGHMDLIPIIHQFT